MIAGVDGCKHKWIAVVEMPDGKTQIRPACTFEELTEDKGLDLIVIDVPMGLVEKGPRLADVLSRQFLGGRGCCVFPAPIRPVLGCETWEEACRTRLSVENKKMSKQQFGILSKVHEVDAAVRRHAETRFREGHPEVSFALMNGGRPISIGKKKPGGRKERTRLVLGCFPDAGERFDEHPYHREDVLDAYALLWTAKRIQRGEERGFPEVRMVDKFGIRMEIVA
jgi:predicted RNase H-like nuclease